jgi:predicted membrane-bound spermidine synthase
LKQPLWKKWYSYFDDVLIEKTESSQNEDLFVLLCNGRYQLCTNNAIYSYADKYDNFKIAFDKLKIEQYDIQEVLILGMGMASIPYMLEKKYKRNYRYTAIEIDEEICGLASRYVLDELKSPIDIITTDAFHYVNMDIKKYDLVAMDVFVDVHVPSKFMTTSFLNKLKNKVHKGGILLYNILSDTKEDLQNSNVLIEKCKSIFPSVSYYNIKGNRIIYWINK